jgi:hypothetical protein
MKYNNFLKKIEEIIYFDVEWKFPEYNLNNYLEFDKNLFDEFVKISKLIVNDFNKRNIDPETYTKDIFYQVVKDLNI